MSMNQRFQPVVLALIQKDDRYLLTLRTEKKESHSSFHNKWQLPGGGVEFGEQVEDALRREIREELGVEAELVALIPKIVSRVRNKMWHGVFICYQCKLVDETAPIVLNHEASEWKWFTKEEIVDLEKLDGIDELIAVVEKTSE